MVPSEPMEIEDSPLSWAVASETLLNVLVQVTQNSKWGLGYESFWRK